MRKYIVKINQGTLQERMIGTLYPELRVFQKEVRESAHLLKVLDAWGIDAKYFNDVLLPKNYLIKVRDQESGTVYKIFAKKFNKNHQYYHFKKEVDHKAQIFCSRTHWETEKPEPKTQDEIDQDFSKKYL